MNLDNITCPVCTLYLRNGITLEQHLQTHPKDQVIEALVDLTNKKTTGVASNGDDAKWSGQYVECKATNANGKTYTQPPWQQNRMVVANPQVMLPMQTVSVANNQSIFYQQFMSSVGAPNFPVNTMVPQYVSIPNAFNQHMLMNPCVYQQQQQQVQIVSGPLVPLGRTFDSSPEVIVSPVVSENVPVSNPQPSVRETIRPAVVPTDVQSSAPARSIPEIEKKQDDTAGSITITEIDTENASKKDAVEEPTEQSTQKIQKPELEKSKDDPDSFEVIFDKINQNPDLAIAKTDKFRRSKNDTALNSTNRLYTVSLSLNENAETITPDIVNDSHYEYLEKRPERAQTPVTPAKVVFDPTPEDFTNSILPHLDTNVDVQVESEKNRDRTQKNKFTDEEECLGDGYDERKSDIVKSNDTIRSDQQYKHEPNDSGNSDVIILHDEVIRLPTTEIYDRIAYKHEATEIANVFDGSNIVPYEDAAIEKYHEVKNEKPLMSFITSVSESMLPHSDAAVGYESTESMNVIEFDGMKLVIPGELINTKAQTAERNFHYGGDNVGEKSPVLLNIGDVNKSPYVVDAEGQEESVSAESLNIRANERMPPKGELSEQESNGASESGWGREGSSGMSTSYDLLARESWEASDCSDTEVPPLQSRVPLLNCYVAETKSLAPPSTPPRHYKCGVCNESFPCPKERRVHQAKEHGSDEQHTVIRSLKTRERKVLEIKSESNEICENNFSRSFETPDDVKKDELLYGGVIAKQSVGVKEFESGALCQVCNIEYPTMKLLQKHYRAMHKDESVPKYKCTICNQLFAFDSKFTEHLRVHPLECTVCGKYFYRRQNMKLHLKRHFGIKPFKCEMCKKSFITKQKLNEHLNCHTGNAPIKCTMCDETFRRHSNLIQHRNTHHFHTKKKYKDFVCHCGEVFHSKKKFVWHGEIHDPKPKACAHCNEKFVHVASLTRHMRKAHNHHYVPDEKRKTENVECEVCKGIYLRTSLDVHMKTHTGVKPYPCNICNKVFSTKWNLKLHRWTHASRASKPYKCTLCKSAFIRQPDYTAHMNSHRSVRPYTCNHCGRQFIRKYNCQRHVKEHEQDKSFSCSVCGKTFHRSYYLKEHLRIHSGARPFSCHICGKMSATKSNHNKHVRIHHARDPVSTEG